jgi:hypothetical protein
MPPLLPPKLLLLQLPPPPLQLPLLEDKFLSNNKEPLLSNIKDTYKQELHIHNHNNITNKPQCNKEPPLQLPLLSRSHQISESLSFS